MLKASHHRFPASARRNGFTLVELLVVVAIISILAALLLPVLAKARLAAIKMCCTSNFKQVMIAEVMYVGDNATFLTPTVLTGGASSSAFLAGYVSEQSYDGFNSSHAGLGKKALFKALGCPRQKDTKNLIYGWNDAHTCNMPGGNWQAPGFPDNPYWIPWQPGGLQGSSFKNRGWPRLNFIRKPSSFVVFREWQKCHEDGSITYGYADGHAGEGTHWWYIWGN